ncbi:ferritin-like domain-containing protein [Methylophaga sp.]|uniref:ferritin-like domain-containing protein n=1 Tax=Methylophaga sp. TaxID=2024840 RepID=UPI003F697D16
MGKAISIREEALACLLIADPWQKAQATQALHNAAKTQGISLSRQQLDVPDVPGRPERPQLVSPRDLPRRRNNQQTGHATLIHAICHIEFNAINLGLDALARFADMPEAYYHDWLQVAYEESTHFEMLDTHLKTMGFSYGDFPAHDGMWEMAQKTHHDPLTRMALVPRVLEARGLDVTPSMMNKLRKSGDFRAVEILELILREEVGHVKVGTDWFNFLCKQRDRDPFTTFKELLETYFNGEIRGPFHTEARLEAGFTNDEMTLLESQAVYKRRA